MKYLIWKKNYQAAKVSFIEVAKEFPLWRTPKYIDISNLFLFEVFLCSSSSWTNWANYINFEWNIVKCKTTNYLCTNIGQFSGMNIFPQ